MNNNNTNETAATTTPDASRLFPQYRVVERKIGKSTFTVYSWFNGGKEKDITSTLARLIQHDSAEPHK